MPEGFHSLDLYEQSLEMVQEAQDICLKKIGRESRAMPGIFILLGVYDDIKLFFKRSLAIIIVLSGYGDLGVPESGQNI